VIACRSVSADGRSTRPRATPDHLAVIRPPAGPRLTARCRLRAVRLPHYVAIGARWGEAPQLYRHAIAPPKSTL
jgi:hypothetical protein